MNGLTKAQTVEMVRSIDLVGMSLCLAEQSNTLPPPHVQSALITMLGVIREQLAMSYGIDIDPVSALTDGLDLRSHLSPSDVADEILRDLNGN